jgi:thiol-disulfide isomerase/thioredoxin
MAALVLLAQEAGRERIGRAAPTLEGIRWIDRDSPPDLRGKVVLLRWWTEGCSLCASTAPAIRELSDRFAGEGLEVLAIYHPKPRPRPVEDEAVRRAAERIGYRYILGVDERWEALRRWWLESDSRRFTSVTFVLDRAGAIAAVHPGGEFHRSEEREHAACARDFESIEATIERLVREKKE